MATEHRIGELAKATGLTLHYYEDIGAAHDWLVRVFGLGPGRVDRDPEGRAVHGELYAGDGVIWLHQEQADWGLGSPRTVGAATASVAVTGRRCRRPLPACGRRVCDRRTRAGRPGLWLPRVQRPRPGGPPLVVHEAPRLTA